MRRADSEIIEALIRQEFVFVLDSRQKGKSSLIVNSLVRLHENGVTTVRIDLQRLGSNLTAEQWYAGLLHAIGQDLNLTKALFDYWKLNIEVGPMTRWFAALEHVVLPSIRGPIVIFVDEVDFVQSLTFSSDEFFAGIRECYNRRSTSSDFRRLAFCLVGVAAPAQLIHNEDVTPFNIGRRVELTDLTRTELRAYETQLSSHGRDGRKILDRIYTWVSGHPYLTQLLAAQASLDSQVRTKRDVDMLVHRFLLSADAREKEANIADTERRLLQASLPSTQKNESRSQVLEIHRLLLCGDVDSARHDGTVISTILLSGIAIEVEGKLRIRNKLYRVIFNERWRRSNLPDAESRRQRAASARAAWKVTWISLAILAVMSVMVLRLLSLTRDRNRALADSKRLNAMNMKTAYEASMALAWERIEDGNFLKAYQLVASQNNAQEKGWEWGFLNAMFQEATQIASFQKPNKSAASFLSAWREKKSLVEFSGLEILQDGKLVALAPSGSAFYGFSDWLRRARNRFPLTERLAIAQSVFTQSVTSGKYLSDDASMVAEWRPRSLGVDLISRHSGTRTHIPTHSPVTTASISQSNRYLQVVTTDTVSHLYDILDRRWLWHRTFYATKTGNFSPDDRLLVISRINADTLVVRTKDGIEAANLVGHSAPAGELIWFSDSNRLLTASSDGSARIWNVPEKRQIRLLVEGRSAIVGMNLSSDERSAIISTHDGVESEWNLDGRSAIQTLSLHKDQVLGCLVSPDGKRCFTTSMDGTGVLVDIIHSRPIGRYTLGIPERAHPMAVSPDGVFFAVVDTSGTLFVVDAVTGRIMRKIQLPGKHILGVDISCSGGIGLTFTDSGGAYVPSWHAEPVIWSSPSFCCSQLCFATDGHRFAAVSVSGDVYLVDTTSMKLGSVIAHTGTKITRVEFSKDGKWLSVACRNNDAHLYALDGSGKKHDLKGHWGRIWGAAFSPDSKNVATFSYDGTVRIWNVDTGLLKSVLQHGSWVSNAVWSPDGKRVITSCADNNIRVFDPTDGFELLKLSGHKAPVLDVRITSDGKTLVSVGADMTLKLWRSELTQSR